MQSVQEIDPGYSIMQSNITYALLGASVIGLLLTLILLLGTEGIRSIRSTKINICLTIALLLASVMFLIQDALINAQDTGVIKLVRFHIDIGTLICG